MIVYAFIVTFLLGGFTTAASVIGYVCWADSKHEKSKRAKNDDVAVKVEKSLDEHFGDVPRVPSA